MHNIEALLSTGLRCYCLEAMRKKYQNGYTLTEVIITVIVLGIIASMAIPNYLISVERTKASEGVQMLEALLNAQRRHLLEYNEYATDISQLDIEVKTPTDKFTDPSVSNETDQLATVKRIALYKLSIDEDGNINCTDDEAPTGTCLKLRL